MRSSLASLFARAAAIAVVGYFGLTAKEEAVVLRSQAPAQDSLLYLPPAKHLPPLSVGYKEAMADLIWLRAVVFAGSVKDGQKIDWLARYVHAIHTLAPNFRRPYLWGGVVSIYSGKEITKDMLDQAVQILREGLTYFPEDHELLFNLGMILYRDYQSLGKLDDATIEAYRQEGAKLIRKAAAFGAPPLIAQLAASLGHEGSDKALQAEFLQRQLMRAQDKGLIRLLRKKLKDLGQDHNIDRIEQERAQFIHAHKSQLPYTPPALFSLLETPPLALRPEVDSPKR